MILNKIVAVDIDKTICDTFGYEYTLMDQQGFTVVNPGSKDAWEERGQTKKWWDDWWIKNFVAVAQHAVLLPQVKQSFEVLRSLGFKIIILTARDTAVCGLTMEQLLRFELIFDGLLFEANKVGYCMKNEIPILVDDRPDRVGRNNGDVVHLMPVHEQNRYMCDVPYVIPCNNWSDILSMILKMY